MKRSLLAVILLFVASSSFAGVMQPLGTHYQVLIPGAGSTPGANATFFRSDITVINLQPRTQTIRMEWLPQNGASVVVSRELLPLSGIRGADFVSEYLGTSGLGAIIVTAVTGNPGVVDTSARLYVAARIWTPQPGTSGTTSQSFPVIPTNTINTPSAALFTVGGGPAPDNALNYRVNVGLVNLDPVNAQTFTVSTSTPGTPTQTVTLQPLTMTQITVGSGHAPSTQVTVQNQTATATRSNNWVAYQSTVNNTSGDAWSELAVTGMTL